MLTRNFVSIKHDVKCPPVSVCPPEHQGNWVALAPDSIYLVPGTWPRSRALPPLLLPVCLS